jgi:hypothetical protein
MARWLPDVEQIGTNEHLGRRLFDEPTLIGAQDQTPSDRLRLNHFMEKRDGGMVSFDRMGQSGIDKRVRGYLVPRATSAAKNFKQPTQFKGWAVIKVKTLKHPPYGDPVPVVPSPIVGEGEAENIYHAHAIPGRMDFYQMALHLQYLFSEHGIIEKFAPDSSRDTRWMRLFVRMRGRLGL